MSSVDPLTPEHRPPTVFVSYASQDRTAARKIRDALAGLGLDVWYDESDLTGGDAWDQKIRRQIRDCDFFMPLISAQTEARHEGYFRREWRLAVERTLDMADDHLFLLPIVLDETKQVGARVPDKFLAVQWLKVPGGEPTPGFEALCRRLVNGDTRTVQPPKQAAAPLAAALPLSARPQYPEFPKEEPGQKTRFWFHAIGWVLQSAWITFKRLPRWVRIIAYLWLVVVVLMKACSNSHGVRVGRVEAPPKISTETAHRLKEISQSYKGGTNAPDFAQLGAQIAREVSKATPGAGIAGVGSPLLAIPFGAGSGDETAKKLADTVFGLVYGRLSMSHPGRVALANEPLPSLDTAVALKRARGNHSTYVLYGAIETRDSVPVLAISMASAEDKELMWSKSYPVQGADPDKIAQEVDTKVGSLQDN